MVAGDPGANATDSEPSPLFPIFDLPMATRCGSSLSTARATRSRCSCRTRRSASVGVSSTDTSRPDLARRRSGTPNCRSGTRPKRAGAGNLARLDKWNEVVASRDVGVAFALVCDRGFAVGLCTHRHAAMGHLVWMATPFFDELPTTDDVVSITSWRWPVFYPLGAALHRRMVIRIGRVEIPQSLRPFPAMRGGGGAQPWFEHRDGRLGGLGTPTEDRNLPIKMIVNHEMMKEMLTTGWMPTDRW
jgi:hypothetical protein